MPIAQPSLSPLRRSLHVIAAGWQRLIKAACDPYRPELHYMRGRGPKWRAAHQQRAERDLL